MLAHPGGVRPPGPGERGEHVDGEDLGGGGLVDGQYRAVHRVDAGVVDQVVEPSERLQGAGDGLLLVGRVVGAAGDADGDLRAAEVLDGLGERLRGARGQAHPGPPGDQLACDAEADAPARSGDDGHPALEGVHHGDPFGVDGGRVTGSAARLPVERLLTKRLLSMLSVRHPVNSPWGRVRAGVRVRLPPSAGPAPGECPYDRPDDRSARMAP